LKHLQGIEDHFLALSSHAIILSSAWSVALQEVSSTSFEGDDEDNSDDDDDDAVAGV
jgi:hypothetical protein